MAENISNMNSDVSKFLDEQNHPFRKEIELLRQIILSAHKDLTENIKWNGPNYSFKNEDRITMRIQPPKLVQLIFHRGAKVKTQPSQKLIAMDYGLLAWKENDRAVATFKNMEEIENCKTDLPKVIIAWINAAQ
jgi:hypothetical protein